MCGIVGYVGHKHVVPILLEGLHRLEYRGYDSAGIAVVEDGELCRVRMQGKVSCLTAQLAERSFASTIGMGHTRWATHGKPSEANAHPHANGDESIMVVHNGIIENYQILREQLSARGYRFSSETDTEVVAHLIEDEYTGDLTQAVKRALRKVTGTYGLVVMHASHPRELVAARRGSPMVLGVGENEMLLAAMSPRSCASLIGWCIWKTMTSRAFGRMSTLLIRWPTSRSPARRNGLNGKPMTSNSMAFRITCSKKFLSSPKPLPMPCAAGSLAVRALRISVAWIKCSAA